MNSAVAYIATTSTFVALVLVGVYVFYDYILKEHVDNHLTVAFRQSAYEADEKAGRKV